MKPYHETELGKLYHGDCLEIMPQLEPVDLVLTDPPYNISNQSKSNFHMNKGIVKLDYAWDNFEITRFSIITDKINSGSVVVFIDNKEVTKWWKILKTAGMKPKQNIYWWKRNKGINPRKNFNSTIESAVFATKNKYIWNGGGCTGNLFIEQICELNYPPNNFHPTQKPKSLFIWLVDLLTEEKSIVIDPFIGSGTTAIACERLKRRWIGIEIEEKYCEIAAKRIEAENKQRKLF